MDTNALGADAKHLEKATFAGGCFWCMEPPFEKLKGVVSVVSGYTGGKTKKPTYEEVSAGSSGHREAIEVTFDPKLLSYETLVEEFWRNIDPTDASGQFVDRGSQYASAIYYHDKKQQEVAENSKAQLTKSGRFSKPIFTPILPAQTFYPAENYHQDFYKKSEERYKSYSEHSGRKEFIEKNWQPKK